MPDTGFDTHGPTQFVGIPADKALTYLANAVQLAKFSLGSTTTGQRVDLALAGGDTLRIEAGHYTLQFYIAKGTQSDA